jgi:enterochelin esterase-like enzyme
MTWVGAARAGALFLAVTAVGACGDAATDEGEPAPGAPTEGASTGSIPGMPPGLPPGTGTPPPGGTAVPSLDGGGSDASVDPPDPPDPPDPDAGTPPVDSGKPPVDAGRPDTGTPPVGGPGPRPTRNCAYSKDADGFFRMVTLTGGVDYWVRLPPTYVATTPYPMVLGTHGCGDNAKNFATWAMAPYAIRATQAHIAVSVGAGRDGQCWNTAADEAKVLAVLDDVRTCFYVHQKKVTMAGYSSGGLMAYTTAMRNARKFAGLLIENSSLQSTFGANTDATLAAAGWKLNVAITARTSDNQFAIATIRADRTKLQGAGFPVQFRELAGGHDGNSDDWTGYLLPKISGYTAP